MKIILLKLLPYLTEANEITFVATVVHIYIYTYTYFTPQAHTLPGMWLLTHAGIEFKPC